MAAKRPRLIFLAVLLNALAFLLSLAATATLLRATAPFPQLGNLWRKYHHYQQHGAEYSLLYIGSSRVFHEFIPREFDAALGGRVKSLNFGQDGMWPPESFYMLRRLLVEKPPGLRWVLIDLMGIKPGVDGNDGSLRALYWHDWPHTLMTWRHILEVPMPGQRTWREKLTLCAHHGELWIERSMGLGLGHERLEVLLKLERNKKPAPLADAGYEPGDNGPLTGTDLAFFNREVAKLRENPHPRPMSRVFREALLEIAAEVRAVGAEPIFVAAAEIYGAERYDAWPTELKLIAFNDPARFPQLYDPARRYDPHHLDPLGAREYTRLLAEEFRPYLEIGK